MESTVRKLLPRLQPPASNGQRSTAIPSERFRSETDQDGSLSSNGTFPQWPIATREETGQKRKRQHLEDHQSQPHPVSQALPSVQHLLTAGHHIQPAITSQPGHARLVRTGSDAYVHEGPFRFLAPTPDRAFPVSILEDSRPLSFAVVEPDLIRIFRRAWNLRQHIRLKRVRGESWLDHVFFNDCFGVENALYTWSSRYEPGMVQYPASKLYKHCLWLLFNRSVQASQASAAYSQVVEDGLHCVRGLDKALGASGDRSILSLPLFLLGVSAFYPEQRRVIWETLDRLSPSCTIESINHAAKSLERLWGMMDEGNVMSTWEWERYHALEHLTVVRDRSLVDLLIDPLAPVAHISLLRSPDLDPARITAATVSQQSSHINSATIPVEPSLLQRNGDVYTPPARRYEPQRNHSVVSVDMPNGTRSDGIPDSLSKNPPDHTSTNKQSSAPTAPKTSAQPPPSSFQEQQQSPSSPQPPKSSSQPLSFEHNNNDSIQVLHRKPTSNIKLKSSIPPCSVCGKKLKNPSDAQKHALQHSKPFHCHEANCTRAQGFATENDLQRHRKSVHGASPRIGNKIGYVCAACPEPGDGGSRKWWPRLDNFKAHVRRKHPEREEEDLVVLSASTNRPAGGEGSYAYSDGSRYHSSSTATSTSLRSSEHGQSRQVSTYEHPYAHARSRSGERGTYQAPLRESPEDEDDAHDDQRTACDIRHAPNRDINREEGGEDVDVDGENEKVNGTNGSSDKSDESEEVISPADAMDVEMSRQRLETYSTGLTDRETGIIWT